MRAPILAVAGFALGMAVLLPLMLIFDGARPWLALLGVLSGVVMFVWGRRNRLRRQ